MTSTSRTHSGRTVLTLLCAWAVVLVMHGAVPFVSTPTLGQAVWSTGFAQSFANQSIWSIFATNFGAPAPAAMAFGLPGAMLTGLFIRMGLPPPDAYSAMVACWMGLAFVGARALAMHWSVSPRLAWVAAFAWMSMPVTWAHAGYSMLSIGIALLPLYLLQTVQQVAPGNAGSASDWRIVVRQMMSYPLISTLAVFMDGYSFMFFAIGGTILLASAWLVGSPAHRHRLTWIALPLHTTSLLLAYLLYGWFIGKSSYSAPAMDVFRGWGADLTFFIQPSQGVHWIADWLGWSKERSTDRYYGDDSVWITTFCMPVLLAGFWAFWRLPRHRPVTLGLICMVVAGFYMALGPSIKLNAIKPQGNVAQTMPAEAGLAPTGSEFISSKLPGLNNMRASYRWTALAVFGAWGLLVLALASPQRHTKSVALLLTCGVVLLNLPAIPDKLENDIRSRSMFFQIEKDLVDPMRSDLRHGERVAFLPWRNDFLVNYVAARLGIVAFNIGGDKNLEHARQSWPVWMRGFREATFDEQFVDRVLMLLASREADAVILPHMNMLLAAHEWPYPANLKVQVRSVAKAFEQEGMVKVSEHPLYTSVRLKSVRTDRPTGPNITMRLKQICLPPVCLKQDGFGESTDTHVGQLKDGRLHTSATQGYLLFGPRVAMNPGSYQLTLKGTSTQDSGKSWVEISSKDGALIHGRYKLGPPNGSVLLQTTVAVPSSIHTLEIRVFVESTDEIQLDGYELRPSAS
jgi:hypothetical protein